MKEELPQCTKYAIDEVMCEILSKSISNNLQV